MGFSKKTQVENGMENETKKWVIAKITVRSLKPINTKKKNEDEDDEEECSTTPTAKESRIPEKLPCPPAPRKRRPSRCNNLGGGVREFFTPPDLETVFKCHVPNAK
ncbi:hypothetical protein RJT34_27735 [Clitoria ternatea]|uniref:Cyclin-dependent protein kinase inhibitor SMR6 n=1 Tax=Clitoria ternatea TaxID=43366 RepID=A0AAN9FA97_CLITE